MEQQFHARRAFLAEATALFSALSFSAGCRTEVVPPSQSDNLARRPLREWPHIPVRGETLPFPEFKSFQAFADSDLRELVQIAIRNRPEDLWLADLHAVAANVTLKARFHDQMTVEEVDTIKHEIDKLAKAISGEILYQEKQRQGELSLREKVEIINSVFYGPEHGKFRFKLSFSNDGRLAERNDTNCLMDEVWDLRRGVCEDLVSAYMCIVDRLNQAGHDLQLFASTVPKHIFIRAEDGKDLFFVDLNEEGHVYDLSEVLKKYQIENRPPHLLAEPYSSLACSISNSGLLYCSFEHAGRENITEPEKAITWFNLMEVAILCSPNDSFYRVKFADQIIRYSHHVHDLDVEERLQEVLLPLARDRPFSREPEVLLARFYASELGGHQVDKAVKLLGQALRKPEPSEGDILAVMFFADISTVSIEHAIVSLRQGSGYPWP